MTIHQVITGALNAGESAFSVGSVDGLNFIACAVGSDVVILASDLERVQVIRRNHSKSEELVNAVNCCFDSGKIAVAYGHSIRIFEPVHYENETGSHNLHYRWYETQLIQVAEPVSTVQWVLEGLRLLVSSGKDIFLYQHRMLTSAVANKPSASGGGVMFSLADEKLSSETAWELVWTTRLATRARFVKFSPDGTLFASCGENDRMVKVWYPKSEPNSKDQMQFSFVYLQHPAIVSGFEWRRTGRYMPRKCVQNALITWCEDNTSRIWKETPNTDRYTELLLDAVDSVTEEKQRRKKSKHSRIKKARSRLVKKLSTMVKDKRHPRLSVDAGGGKLTRSSTFADFAMPAAANTLNFCLAATIDAENDCLLVPSMSSFNPAAKKTFAVHWLNNKELMFTSGAEKILAEALLNEHIDVVHRGGKGFSPTGFISNANSVDGSTSAQADSTMPRTPSSHQQLSATDTQNSSSVPRSMSGSDIFSAKDILDVKLEGLLRQWNKSYDVLFSVHPVDGSLLTWTVEWLDDNWRQPTVSFSSRFPNAFPITDASSLNLSLSTFNPHDPVYVEVLQRHPPDLNENTNENAETMTRKRDKLLGEVSKANTVLLLTSHENGSLNLWHLAMDDRSQYTTIQNILHRSRMCGHRFHIQQIVPHPVLPLLLTASRFVPTHGKTHSVKEAELILWKVAPVGPLCKSGGVRELARVTSCTPKAFTTIAWIPAILPSSTLGSVCNSPSSCFVASNAGRLCVYQAVVDARGLLSELFTSKLMRSYSSSSIDESDAETVPSAKHQSLCDTFNVVSTQSTAKPGCVLNVCELTESDHSSSDVLLLHVFDEDLAISVSDTTPTNEMQPKSHAKGFAFADKYFAVMTTRASDGSARIKMWALNVSSQPAVPIVNKDIDEELSESLKVPGGPQYYPTAEGISPSAAKLAVTSEKVFDAPIDLPPAVEVISCTPSAGHLPSASLYPACRAPYILVLACSDDQLRFLRCVAKESPDGTVLYEWEPWKMVSDRMDSSLETDGEIYGISAAHSGRIACAYHATGQRLTEGSIARKLHLAIFECESSGGIEWLQEDTFSLEKCFLRSSTNYSATVFPELKPDAQGEVPTDRMRRLVRIDWVSAQDGSHILTVGLGHVIYFFAQVSHNTAQQNIAMMSEKDSHQRAPLRKASSLVGGGHLPGRTNRWVCIRTLELSSADGLPPLPTAMSWVRDGLLIIGMQSEMRVYNQWDLSKKELMDFQHEEPAPQQKTSEKGLLKPVSMNISRSHSMLEQLNKKQKADPASSTKLMKEIMSRVMSLSRMQEMAKTEADEHGILEAVSHEGLFEAARLSNPMLPQYHPKQLIEMLNAGKTKRVKAILLHVLRALKQRNVSMPNPLTRAASIRRMVSQDGGGLNREHSVDATSVAGERRPFALEDDNPDYQELDGISPLPLYALFAADHDEIGHEKAANIDHSKEAYDSLFKAEESDEDLDEMLYDIQNTDRISRRSSRSRHSSGTSETFQASRAAVHFTARHSRALTELLTHTHLPGLSSVDQMHLLAVADTLSHFSSNVMDKLAQANAAMQPAVGSTLGDAAASGYATTGTGVETVDECGLRFLIAMKQHEYLLLCLPLKQRKSLKTKGMSTSHIIWAFHSDTEMELLNTIPCCQKSQETWGELRSYGVAWWLKNTATLRVCVEKMAKAAFQANQNPMDASLFYMALRKKNVLMHLFRSVRDTKMHDFFREDFTEEKWKKAALKNAFVLLSKQRFEHAAAFFLLAGSLKDALQAIVARLKDIQLAMVVLKLYETDPDKQARLMEELLCKEVLGCEPEEWHKIKRQEWATGDSLLSRLPHASRDPFERSMALWLMKEYAYAATTLVDEASKDNFFEAGGDFTERSLSDIFNFYSFLRKHPLVVRQRLTNAGVQMATTEKFLAFSRDLENRVTPSERRLYFRTAAAHMTSGCPLLALDVLSTLPRKLCAFLPGTSTSVAIDEPYPHQAVTAPTVEIKTETVEAVDWAAPTHPAEDKLELKWSDDEEEEKERPEEAPPEPKPLAPPPLIKEEPAPAEETCENGSAPLPVDFISQQLKFIAALRILMEELSTLASGFEVDGGQLRYEVFRWLEKECDLLKEICDYHVDMPHMDLQTLEAEASRSPRDSSAGSDPPPLHEAIQNDRVGFNQRIKNTLYRRQWLCAHQKLIRTFTSYCVLHSAQNYRLTSVLMELLLLLLEVQQEIGSIRFVNEPVPDIHSFPLLVSSVSSCRMFVSSPLHFVHNQSTDLLLSVIELKDPPTLDGALPKVYMMYNLSQGLSSCVYQSLSDIDHFFSSSYSTASGPLTRRVRTFSTATDDVEVISPPDKWPGVDNLIALLSRDKDEETPDLRLLLVEFYVAITMSLFSYAFTVYDARWLYRLCAHEIDAETYATLFGGGGEKKLRAVPPARPPPPARPAADPARTDDPAVIRAKLHAKVFGADVPQKLAQPGKAPNSPLVSEQVISCWVPPRKHIVQYFADRVPPNTQAENEVVFDSDDSGAEMSDDEDEDVSLVEARPHDDPNSYAWLLIRLAAVLQQQDRLRQFIKLSGFDPNDMSTALPRVDSVLKLLSSWASQLEEQLESYPEGCPIGFLPHTYVEPDTATQTAPLLRKYRSLIEKGNTPFEYEAHGVLAVKRLWTYLVRQENLSAKFIKYVFGPKGTVDTKERFDTTASTVTTQSGSTVSDSVKIIQREHEPIVAFACNGVRPGWITVSTGREVQEISIEGVLEEREKLSAKRSTFLNNRVELDIALDRTPRDPLKDNDDYQLLLDTGKQKISGTSYLRKRPISGVRRLESHPTLPYYITGASDGSILLWEWGVEQPLFTARQAGQYAKVTKLAFSLNGNKFAAVDGDGLLCLWQATQSHTVRKPFFNQKCHNKSAADVKFLGQTSSLLVTAGQSTGDQNVCMWDTLMPQAKAMVHSFTGHQDGATCVVYSANTQTILSGGKHGEICLWDVRQRQLRTTLKAFDTAVVKCLAVDANNDVVVAGSSEGDIKVWTTDAIPQQLHTLPGEHVARGGFSLRQVASSLQGVQQVHVDGQMRLYSCGADCSLKFRTLPSLI